MLNTILQSSRNPQTLSLTIRGLLLQFIPLVLVIAQVAGWQNVDENTLTTLVESITLLVAGLLQLVSTFMIAWGLFRKLLPTAQELDEVDKVRRNTRLRI